MVKEVQEVETIEGNQQINLIIVQLKSWEVKYEIMNKKGNISLKNLMKEKKEYRKA